MEKYHLSPHTLVRVIAPLLPQIQIGLLMRKFYLNSSVHIPKEFNSQKAHQREMHILVPSPTPPTQTIINTPVRQFTPAICTVFLFGLVVFLGVNTKTLFTITGTQLLSRLPVRVLTRTRLFNLKRIIPFIQAKRESL